MPGKGGSFFKLALFFITTGVFLTVSVAWGQKNFYYDWTAPPDFVSLKNPLPDTSEVRSQGESVFKKWCLRCHGAKGDGEGSSSLSLRIPPGDFTDKKRMKAQTDGVLFWKIRIGRGEMPPWQLMLKDDEIWKAIRFIRKFSK